MKEYVFNENGICLNPNEYYHEKDGVELFIRTCFFEDKWRATASYFCNLEGFASSPSNKDYDGKFDTEKESYEHALSVIVEMFNKGALKENQKLRKTLEVLLGKAKNIDFPDSVQLKLFE